MEKFAVIDIGSNSVRLMVADGKILYKKLETTRLGEGIAFSPYLKEEAMLRSATAVARFKKEAEDRGITTVFAFATAAVRSAKNREIFIQSIKNLCNIEVEVLSGEEEARLGILGAAGESDGGMIDAGGASTEIVVQKSGKIIYKKSVDIGVVRLKDLCGRDYKKLVSASLEAAKQYGEIPQNIKMYGIGGTATTLGAMKVEKDIYDPALVSGTILTADELMKTAKELSQKDVEEIAKIRGVMKGRADVIGGGAVLLATLLTCLGIPKLIVSDSDNLEGFARSRNLLL